MCAKFIVNIPKNELQTPIRNGPAAALDTYINV